MNIQKIKYTLHSGKNNKLLYYIHGFAKDLTPPILLKLQRRLLLKGVEKRSDYEYIKKRVDYYCRLSEECTDTDMEKWKRKSVEVGNQPMTSQKVYYLDSMEYARAFPLSNR